MELFKQSKRGDSAADRLWSLLGDHNTFMLVTLTTDGRPPQMRARPMAGYPKQDEHRIWFLTHRDGLKDNEVEADRRVCVTHANSEKQHFVSLTGRANVVDDVARKKELWSIAAQAWFPAGPEHEDIVLIRVDLDEAEFWDGEANSIVLGIKMAAAVANDERVDAGDNEKIDLSGATHAAAAAR